MNIFAITPVQKPGINRPPANLVLWLVFLIYLIVLGYASAHHQMWWDEINAWDIAKASNNFSDLLKNTRYEGHPPAWHIMLWLISKCTNNLMYVQLTHALISSIVVFILLFFAPFPLITRVLIPFGYYFLFEYAVIDRNYAIGVLAAFCLCIVLRKEFKYKYLLYYALLFFMANTHLLAIVLGGSLHLYFLLSTIGQGKRRSTVVLHVLAGILVFLPSLYFIFPPSDSTLDAQYWVSKWSYHKIVATINSPIQAFIPVPAWWKYNCWNTQFLLEAKDNYPVLKIADPLISAGLLALVFFILRKSKKSMLLFAANLFVSFIISIAVLTLTTARYAGFLYIGFITAYWLYCYEMPPIRAKWPAVNILLVIQLVAGIFFVSLSVGRPFSNLYRVNELIGEVPVNERMVTDYGTMNVIVTYTSKPAYCVDLQREASRVAWNADIATIENTPNRYTVGIRALFQRSGLRKIYMVSRTSPQQLFNADPLLSRSFRVLLVDKREGAIEKGSNLYLYLISSF